MSDGPAMFESNEGTLAPVLSSVISDLPLTMPISDVGTKINQPTIKDIADECILQFYKVMLARMWQLRSKCLTCMVTSHQPAPIKGKLSCALWNQQVMRNMSWEC
jgi:hypothetical protein